MISVSPVGVPPVFVHPAVPSLDLPSPKPDGAPRPFKESHAIDIWIARWLRVRRKELVARYGCDPRRLYEIWEEKRFAGSRDRARALFAERYPALADRIDYGRHRTVPRKPPAELQPGLFDGVEM